MTTPASGQISIQDIVDEFGGTAPHALSEYYGVASGVPTSGQISLSDFYGKSNIIPAPVGLIVPYTSGTAPSGWTRFTSADDKFIVGAGSTYSNGSTGGSTSPTISGTLSSTGSHAPWAGFQGADNYGSGKADKNNGSAGSHNHTFSGTVTAQDVYKNFVLIKCTSSGVQIPQNAILLASTSLSGLTNVETTTDRFIRSASSYGGTGGSSSISGSITSSSSGSHTHGLWSYGSGGCSNSQASGAHTHSVSISGSLNTKRMYLSAWTNARASYDLTANGIAMWESATPPSGWYICNGANGTPDLRDFFVRIGTTANHGTTSGNNSVSWSASAPFSGSHTHGAGGGLYYYGCASVYHANYAWSHTHTASGSATILPPYYGLYFIMYGG